MAILLYKHGVSCEQEDQLDGPVAISEPGRGFYRATAPASTIHQSMGSSRESSCPRQSHCRGRRAWLRPDDICKVSMHKNDAACWLCGHDCLYILENVE